MNKIKFDAKVLDLYSEDFEYLQDTVEENVHKVGRHLLADPFQKGIIRGFDLEIGPTDLTTVSIYHNNTPGAGYLLTSTGDIIETSTGISDITMSDYILGTVNNIFMYAHTADASYDKVALTPLEGVKRAIDFSNYSLQYDRVIEKCEVKVYTNAEVAALPNLNGLILLGSVTANGIGVPLTNLTSTGRHYCGTFIAPGSITVESLAPGFLLPQTYVDNSATIDDHYTGTPADLEDDLNKVRTKIREIQGTTAWDDAAPVSLINFDALLNALHANGIFAYGNLFATTVLTSSGITYAKVDSGKALAKGAMVVVSIGTYSYVALADNDTQHMGNWIAKTGYESHNLVGLPQGTTFQLNEATLNAVIQASSLHITDTSNVEYNLGSDYTYDSSTGSVTTVIGGDIANEIVYCYYDYGFKRYDTIEAKTDSTVSVVTGIAQDNPVVPTVDAGATRLFNILRIPFTTTSTGNVIDSRFYVPKVRDRIEINANSYLTSPYSTNYFTYHKSTDIVDDPLSVWSVVADGDKYYATTSTLNSYISTSIYTQTNDELWLRVSKNATTGSLTVYYEEVPGSGVLNLSKTFTLTSNHSADDILLFVAKGFSEGQHRVKIKVTAAVPYKIYGLVYGKLSLVYTKDVAYFSNLFSDTINVGTSIVFEDDNTLYRSSTGILTTNNDFSADHIIVRSAPTTNIMVGNKEYNDDRYANRDEVFDRLNNAELKNVEQDLRLGFLEQRPFNTEDEIVELFMNEDIVDPDFESSSNFPVDIQKDSDWNNNWKENTTDFGPSFKNGFMRPRRYFFIMEPREYYQLEGVGQSIKCGISRFDTINNCYWLLTAKGINDIGEIVRLGPRLKNGLVEVLGGWYLPAMGANTAYLGLDVDTTGTYLYVTLQGDSAAIATRPNALYKIKIDNTIITTGTKLGLGKAVIGQTLAIDYGTVGTGSKVKSCTTNGTTTVTTAAGTADLRVGMALWSLTAYTLETYITEITNSTTFKTSRVASGSVTEAITFSDVTGRFVEFLSGNNLFADCTVWDSGNTDIGFVYTTAAAGANRAFDIRFRQTAVDVSWPRVLQLSALSNITMNPYLIAGNNQNIRAIYREHSTNYLWFKLNDVTSDMRFIYRINTSTDIVSNVMLSHSGRFRCTRGVDESGNGGITISSEGEFLEVVGTASNGNFISERALKNALWAENHVDYAYRMNATLGTMVNPVNPLACMVESSTYYWTGDSGQAANTCDIYRFDTVTGNYKCARITGAAWTWILDACTDGTTLWVLGYDGTNYDVYYGVLSTFVTAMGADNPNTHPPASSINITTWGTLVAMGGNRTNVKAGICYDSDSTILYVHNNTNTKIDTLTPAGVYTASVYDLPAPTNQWLGIAYKNGKIFVRDKTNTTTPCRIYVMDKAWSGASAWYRFHIYQDPAETFVAAGSYCIDFSGNALVTMNTNYLQFYKQKTLEDSAVLQLHTFIQRSDDGGATLNPYSLLLSTNLRCHTPIAERYFDPTEFADGRNVPDKNYMAISYADEGFTLLHLDEYLGDQTTLGIPRYDVRKIRFQHYKKGGAAIGSANVVYCTGVADTLQIWIDKDMIFFALTGATDWNALTMIDLKSGKAYIFHSGSSRSGFTYLGSLSERNDGKGYGGVYNAELDTTYAYSYGLYARTFMKTDSSDYNQENPKTFVLLEMHNGAGTYRIDMLVIDWDQYGNRTPSKVFNTIGNAIQILCGAWIAPSGYIFGGSWDANGSMYVITNDGASGTGGLDKKVFAWQIDRDSSGSAQIGTNICAGYVWTISSGSRCWRTVSGTWRHILCIGVREEAAGQGVGRLMFLDVENTTYEVVHQWGDGSLICYSSDTYEDLVVSQLSQSATLVFNGFGIYRKQRFQDKVATYLSNNWSPASLDHVLTHADRPVFTLPIYTVTIGPSLASARIMGPFNIISNQSNLGLQFIHIAWTNDSTYQTKELDIDDPQAIYYIEHWSVE